MGASSAHSHVLRGDGTGKGKAGAGEESGREVRQSEVRRVGERFAQTTRVAEFSSARFV